MARVMVMDHPLIQHKIGYIRKTDTGTMDFRNTISEIAALICYEATRELTLEDVEIETPICRAMVKQLKGKKMAIVPILRAGLGMVDGVLNLIPAAKVGHIGLYRDPETLQPVPMDGETMGEIMFRGNITMKGYLKNPKATDDAFRGGWFHSGDLAVQYPDGYIQIKDRSKDIIISGGENISSIEVEDVLYRHPAVLAAAVVAKPDEKWGETPCAFLEIKSGTEVTEQDIIAHCKQHLAGYKVPRAVVFGELPKTSTGKIQKFELRKQVGSAKAIAA